MAPINCFFWTYACVFHVAHRPYKQPNNVGQAARLRRSETSLVRREKCFHDVVAAGCLGSRVPVSFLLLGWVHKTSGKRLCDSTESDELVLIHTHPRLLLSHAKACWWCCRSKLGVRPPGLCLCLPACPSLGSDKQLLAAVRSKFQPRQLRSAPGCPGACPRSWYSTTRPSCNYRLHFYNKLFPKIFYLFIFKPI